MAYRDYGSSADSSDREGQGASIGSGPICETLFQAKTAHHFVDARKAEQKALLGSWIDRRLARRSFQPRGKRKVFPPGTSCGQTRIVFGAQTTFPRW